MSDKKGRIAVVGPCAAGKSTLVAALRAANYETRHVAQEHSGIKDLWRRLYPPDLLIYLDADFDAIQRRRPGTAGSEARLAAQRQRLSHARTHCDLYLDTTPLTIEQVRGRVFAFLGGWEDEGEDG